MALDGLVIANLAWELSRALTGGRISKIYQPESDALVLTVKNNRENYRLLLSANASLPLVYLTEDTPSNPAAAPNFCMLLRKHIGGGKILSVTQPGMERILHFEIEHLDEMGDLQTKLLIVELMGKHSNIIFCQPDRTIIDSIKHISAYISSVREVLPGRPYFIAETQKKFDPWTLGRKAFTGIQEECGGEEAEAPGTLQPVMERPAPAAKAIYTAITGISPLIAEEICCRAGIDSSRSTSSLTEAERLHLFGTFERLMDEVREHAFVPNIVYDGSDVPVEFSCVRLKCYEEMRGEEYASISEVLVRYYAAKNAVTRMRQKSSDLRGIVKTLLERCRKKYALQQKQMSDTEKKDKYRIYGEMINTYGYEVEPGAKVLECVNYYDGKEIKVPLDPTLSPHDNSLKYFDRYAKLKRTADALTGQIEETRAELEHLESIQTALEMAPDEAALTQVKEELVTFGFIKGHGSLQDRGNRRQGAHGQGGSAKQRPGRQKKQQARSKSRPYHYISGDGYDIYVGKNNFQNEEITFSLADGSDWWFHAKGMPGSHVIVKARGEELPDNTFEEAGRLAAYYSKGREAEKVEIDYIQKKHVKKTPGGRPGFVIYHTNYSMVSKPDIEGIREV